MVKLTALATMTFTGCLSSIVYVWLRSGPHRTFMPIKSVDRALDVTLPTALQAIVSAWS